MQDGRKWLFWVNFFSFKSAWIFPCIFLVGLHFVSEKNEDKILKHAQWTQQSWTRAFQPKKIQENVLLLNWKAHAKILALLKEKILHEKVTCIHLAPSYSILGVNPLLYTLLIQQFKTTLICMHTNSQKLVQVQDHVYCTLSWYHCPRPNLPTLLRSPSAKKWCDKAL